MKSTSMFKRVVLLNIFVESLMNRKNIILYVYYRVYYYKEQHLFEVEIVCNIIKVFIATFDQSIASLLNKTMNFLLFSI